MPKIKLIQTKDYLLLIDEEAEIKENTNTFKEGTNGDWYWNSIYDFVRNHGDTSDFDFKVIAYYPLTKEAEELDLPLLPNPFKEDTDVEKLAQSYLDSRFDLSYERTTWQKLHEETFAAGYKAAQSKQFSLEDVKKAIEFAYNAGRRVERDAVPKDFNFNTFSKELIQSLSTQQLPKEFIPEKIWINSKGEKGNKFSDVALFEESINNYDAVLKLKLKAHLYNNLTTNSEGKEELVGTYKY